jgi:hypothetical protein
LQQAQADDRGFRYDRRWMLVTPSGRFLTQREHPRMALLRPELRGGSLLITYAGQDREPLSLDLAPQGGEAMEVEIWGDRLCCIRPDPLADAWFSEALGATVHLIYMPDEARRPVDARYARQGEITSLSDGYPFLILGQASLDHLNAQLEAPLPMNRFRPNLVFTGGEAHEEDRWGRFRVGSLQFHAVKPCARCTITTIDQERGSAGKEPLRTLARYRSEGNKVLFGMNLLHEGPGEVAIGDEILLES